MRIQFEWDPAKAARNERKHGVRFEDAASAFLDPQAITIPDPMHSEREDRFVLVGRTLKHTLVVVVHFERNERIRIISARRATRSEAHQYEEEQG